LGDGSQFGVNLIYSDEQKEGALETAGGIIKALPLLCHALDEAQNDKPFLVVNGDVWCDYAYTNQNPLKANDLAHLIMVNNPEHNPDGDFYLSNNRVDTNSAEAKKEKYTFSGIAYYHPDLFKDLPSGKQALAPLLRKAMSKKRVSGELYAGDWRDIGTPERLEELNLLL